MANRFPAPQLARRRRGNMLASILLRGLLYGGGWIVLTHNDPTAWLFLPVVVTVLLALSYRLYPPSPLGSPWRLALLLPRLAWDTVLGGLDVARRAFDPRLPIAPALIEVELDPPRERLQIALAYVMTIMPGTLAVAPTERGLVVHVIDRRQTTAASAAALARRLRRVVGGQ